MNSTTPPSLGSLVDPSKYPRIALVVNDEALAASSGSRGDYKELYQEFVTILLHAFNSDSEGQAQLNELRQNLDILSNEKVSLESALQAANAQYNTLQTTFARSFQSLASTTVSPNSFDSKAIAFDEFKNFRGEGDKADLGIFLYNIHAKFLHNGYLFRSEQARMAWYATRLEGDARRQIKHALKDDGHVDLENCDAITAILKTAYSDPDASRVAITKLRELTQGKKTFSDFVVQFQALYPTCDREDVTIIEILEQNIHPDLYQRLINLNTSLPSTIPAYIALCRVEDANLRKIKDQARDQKTGQFRGRSGGSNTSTAGAIDDPMDVSKMDLTHVQNGRLTADEKQRRIANNLCMYDGENHPTVSCPKLKLKEQKALEDLIAGASKETLLAAAAKK